MARTLTTPAARLDPREVARTLAPVERATMLPPRRVRRSRRLRLGAREHLPRLGLRRPRLGGRRAGQVRDARARPRQRRRHRRRGRRPRAFLNVCRHRGARIVEEAEGQVRKRLRCPYHSWSYGLDGSLRAAPHMDGVEDFDFSCWGLIPVRLAVVGGLVLIDLSRRGRRHRRARRRAARPTSSATASSELERGGRASTTTSRRTGRGSPRTTTSACTAPACTRSSTRSATT